MVVLGLFTGGEVVRHSAVLWIFAEYFAQDKRSKSASVQYARFHVRGWINLFVYESTPGCERMLDRKTGWPENVRLPCQEPEQISKKARLSRNGHLMYQSTADLCDRTVRLGNDSIRSSSRSSFVGATPAVHDPKSPALVEKMQNFGNSAISKQLGLRS